MNRQYNFESLLELVSTLRSPHGCPWDAKQTSDSLTRYLQEETNELVEAINSKDKTNSCEEIGDILFILASLIVIHDEKNDFAPQEPFKAIINKMIRRHPHVFAEKKNLNDNELREQWRKIKAQEKSKL